MDKLSHIAQEALAAFPEIREVRLFGSLARGDETGLSDIDLLVITEREEPNPIERVRPYFFFFSQRLPLAMDVLAIRPSEVEDFLPLLYDSLLLGKREGDAQLSFRGERLNLIHKTTLLSRG